MECRSGWPARRSTRRRFLSLPVARGRRLARRLAGGTLDLIYPAACAGCGAEIENDAPRKRPPTFCRACLDQLPLLTGPTCPRCGAAVPLAGWGNHRCALCRGASLWFDQTIALGEYAGLLREWILRMKRRHGDRLTLALAELIWQRHRDWLVEFRPDVVVPVTSHWRRRWAHGTNSAAVLAERLADRLRVPLATGLLRRVRSTEPQFTVPPSQRRANVRGAFAAAAGYHLERARVLLVDDILTTGATASEASRVLKRLGATRVAVAVAGRTLQH